MSDHISKLVNQYITYGIAIAVILLVGFIMEPVLVPCSTAMIVAYLLNPLVNKLEKLKLPRQLSVLIILTSVLYIIIACLVILIPLAYSQLLSLVKFLAEKIPVISKNNITPFLQKYNISEYEEIVKAIKLPESSLESLLNYDNMKSLLSIFSTGLKNIDTIFLGAINSSINISYIVSTILITLIFLFYILSNWPSIIKQATALIPVKYQNTIKQYTEKIDHIISAYIKGQLSVCLIMAIYYTICLCVINLKYFFIIGLISGMMTFIPYIGPIFCAVLSCVITMLQFNNWTICCIVIVMFIIGQTVESNVITPFLIGKRIDIHPIWIIIGMIICGSQIGFIGILLSIPITAIAGVFIKSIVNQYMNSKFYSNID
ncbi:AI-2E family transporter [Ehrlichia ruminantium]|uniref:AI-2E family transporter n=1 Tax=Ehrlichia ruminantium TaxID=779 RepID=A0AAE6Q8T3_EHRRU|nr:AI-2E family transporter [Ehrlichia ruminantium]QGR02276.1 AI-2E family transporter [Ehrlichia ruminantium]QGR03196.1 AI-2E family transporter [Ehrlichia ruminantium]QGR04121.1 AI-2E family transporter [Ehrlichia ruminantium]